MTQIRFTVAGRPQGKGSKRAQLIPGTTRFTIRDAVEIELRFFFARPKAHMGTGKNAGIVLASAPRRMIVMPDVDKLCRCAIDSLTGIVFKDDSQIARLVAVKSYGEPERCEVEIR